MVGPLIVKVRFIAGDAIGITLPKQLVSELGLETGEYLSIITNKKRKTATIKKVNTEADSK